MPGPGDEIAPGAGGHGHLRASRADREQVIGALKAAFVQGRLAKDEFELREGELLELRWQDLDFEGALASAVNSSDPEQSLEQLSFSPQTDNTTAMQADGNNVDLEREMSGLTQNDFRVFDDNQLEAVTHFSAERVPVSLGILLDTSASMEGDKIVAARAALARFLNLLNDPRLRRHPVRIIRRQGAGDLLQVLQPHLASFGVAVVKPRLTGPHGRRGGRIPHGGMFKFVHALADIRRWTLEDQSSDARFSTMVDLMTTFRRINFANAALSF